MLFLFASHGRADRPELLMAAIAGSKPGGA